MGRIWVLAVLTAMLSAPLCAQPSPRVIKQDTISGLPVSKVKDCARIQVGQVYENEFTAVVNRVGGLNYCLDTTQTGHGTLLIASEFGTPEDPKISFQMFKDAQIARIHHGHGGLVDLDVDPGVYWIRMHTKGHATGKFWYVFVMGDGAEAARAMTAAIQGAASGTQSVSNQPNARDGEKQAAAGAGEMAASQAGTPLQPSADSSVPTPMPPDQVVAEYMEAAGVTQVAAGSPAANAGLLPGDILLAVNGVDVNGSIPAIKALRSAAPGEPVTLSILRGKSLMEMKATPTTKDGRPWIGAVFVATSVADMPVPRYTGYVQVTNNSRKSYYKAIELGDQITAVDGVPVVSMEQIEAELQADITIGRDATFTLRRGGKTMQVPSQVWRWPKHQTLIWDRRGDSVMTEVREPRRFVSKWPVFPEVPRISAANAVQQQDLADLKRLRDAYLKLVSPTFKPVAVFEGTHNRMKAKFCDGLAGPVEMRFKLELDQSMNQTVLTRLLNANCNGAKQGQSYGLEIHADGSWAVGRFSFDSKSPWASLVGLHVYGGAGKLTLMGNSANAVVDVATGDMLLRQRDEALLGVVPGTLYVAGVGSVDGEIENAISFRPAPNSVVHAVDDAYRASGPLKVMQAAGDPLQDHSFGSAPFSLAFDGVVRFDTKSDTSMGPAGTYLFTGRLPAGSMPLWDEVQPGPGTLAQYASKANQCTVKPQVPQGWLIWAPNCDKDPKHVDVWSVDGHYRMRYSAGEAPLLQSFSADAPGEAEREWRAQSFTNEAQPTPVGEATMFEWGAPVYRGQFAGLEPNGEGRCPVPGETTGADEPCTFDHGKRIDTLYLARVEQEKLDARSQEREAAAQQALRKNDAERKRIAREREEQARLEEQQRQAELRAEREARAARREAMFGAVMNGLQQAANQYSADQQAEALAAQQRQAQIIAQRDAAELQRQQNEAAARERAAQQKQQQAAVAADNARNAQQRQQAELAAQRAAQERQQAAAEQRRLAAQQAQARQQALAQQASAQPRINIQVGTNTISPALPNSSGTMSGDGDSNSSAPPRPAETVYAWPEGLVACDSSGCEGPFQSVAGNGLEAANSACGLNGTSASDYGTIGHYHVWGCGYGLDTRGGHGGGQYQHDVASAYGLHPTQRRTFHCTDAEVTQSASMHCYKP